MRIWVFSYCYNEAKMMPFYLRHYTKFADKIVIFDDRSTDATRGFFYGNRHVEWYEWPPPSGMDEDHMLAVCQQKYKRARGLADWVMWVDIDEFIYGEDIPKILEGVKEDVVTTEGFNMMCDGMPVDDGISQIYDLCSMGVPSKVYSKPVVFRPHLDMHWIRGRHALERMPNVRITPKPLLKLLHYRYMGYDHTKERNARNYDRVGRDKNAAWTCAPDYTGTHSAVWARESLTKAIPVLP